MDIWVYLRKYIYNFSGFRIISNRKIALSLLGLLGVILLLGLFYPGREKDEFLRVEKIIDGDTILLENGESVRYLGIDSPEFNYTEAKEECGAKGAKELNEKLITGKKIRLEKDVTDRDKYGRLLRFVFTEDGEFVNYSIIRQGYAKALFIPPGNKYKEDFLDALTLAKKEKLGIWGSCFNE